MACRCAERREAIRIAATAVVDRDMKALAKQAEAFRKTIREDANDLASRIRSGISSLKRRRP